MSVIQVFEVLAKFEDDLRTFAAGKFDVWMALLPYLAHKVGIEPGSAVDDVQLSPKGMEVFNRLCVLVSLEIVNLSN